MDILDSTEVRGITADGDERVTLILITYDPTRYAYNVEHRCDGQYEDNEYVNNLDDARELMRTWEQQVKYHYEQERLSHERGLAQEREENKNS